MYLALKQSICWNAFRAQKDVSGTHSFQHDRSVKFFSSVESVSWKDTGNKSAAMASPITDTSRRNLKSFFGMNAGFRNGMQKLEAD